MTKREVLRRMAAAGITGEVTGKADAWEVELPDDAAKDVFLAKVCDAGGYRTGYGAWVLRPGYKVSSLEGLADPMHY